MSGREGKLYQSYYQCRPLLKDDEVVPWFAVDRDDCGFGKCDVVRGVSNSDARVERQ